jgi:hypothetical protein
VKLSFRNEKEIKSFQDMQITATRPALQEMLREFFTRNRITVMKRNESIKLTNRTGTQ